MNVPRVSQNALSGFIIPPRTFMQMMYSAFRGAMGLINIDNRAEFIDKLDKGTINERVMSQATAGPMMMLSLFHDLQNPLFKRYKFDATEFLEGMAPALERYHSVSSALENEFIKVKEEAEKKSKDEMGNNDNAENQSIQQSQSSHGAEDVVKGESAESIAAILNYDWMDIAKKKPESLAGQLSRMVTTELFSMHQSRAKASFLLSGGSKVAFKEGSCTVNNVALLSARAYLCVEKDVGDDDIERWGDRSDQKYEIVDYDMEEEELKKKRGGVAAQLEVLYDVTHSFVEVNPSDSPSKDKEVQELDLTTVSVAVVEGWLFGGPDNQLRWKLALDRPALEFPGVQVSVTM